LPMKKRGRKAVHGAGFLSDALGMVGLGLPMEKGGKMRAVPPSVPVDRTYSAGTAPFQQLTPHERQVMGVRLPQQHYQQGPGMVSSTVRGAGLLSTPLGMFGLGLDMKKRGRKAPAKAVHGAGFLSDALGSIGLGLDTKKRGRKAVHGAGFLSDALGMVGLGLPHRMRDKKLGSKLTKQQKDKIHAHVAKVHGGGFADMFLKGLITPLSAVKKLTDIVPIPGLSQIAGGIAGAIPDAVTKLTGITPLI
jgi:hypothetical protein